MEYKFTIFTPVYNGASFFYRVFESLKSQTYRNFEWIIINDGSIDNSDEVICNFINQVDWDITYIKQENCGKHVSWNKAVKLAKGELFLPCDCDDSFVSDTLAFFNEKWKYFKKNDLSGINVLCYNPSNNAIIGNQYPSDGYLTNNLRLIYETVPSINGEKWGCIRVDLLKECSFPELTGSFFTENYLWFSLAKKYNVICFNKPIRAYYTTENSLCNRKRNINTIRMFRYYNRWFLKSFFMYILKKKPMQIFDCLIYNIKADVYLLLNKIGII